MDYTTIKTPKQSLNPAFLKIRPERKDIEHFKKEFSILMDRLKANPKESEEFHKNLVIDFLDSVYYKNKYYINTFERNDLVIHNSPKSTSSVGVLIEAKSPTNKAEMVTCDNFNVKSFQELVLYYLRERKTNKNFELRYLVITNVNEWFVFDAHEFERLFYKNKKLLKHYEDFVAGRLSGNTTNFFYTEIAPTYIKEVQKEIAYTYFDIRSYEKIIRSNNIEEDKQLIALYKFLSPTHLLKLPFAQDYNELNKDFYDELLHILGLKEVKEDGKKVIVRKPEKERDNGSFIEGIIYELESRGISDVSNVSNYGTDSDERLFNIALDLSITWINRILFLKLLEAQVIKYKSSLDYAFLSSMKLDSFDELNGLFFHILAVKPKSRREGYLKDKFNHVPYLNSSLFEHTKLERETITINTLPDKAKIALYNRSALKTSAAYKGLDHVMNPLKYLLDYLDSYDFSSEGYEDIQEESKALISASVLGLIFEKINGYKDGSFFTPSFITMYMCRETITKAILQKFYEHKGWECKDLVALYNKIDDLAEANEIIDSIRICDPAVGSGHFLVSSLNELIHIKSELGVLVDKDGKRLKGYDITIENDELIITDEEGSIFKYNPSSKESQRMQESLFLEKQKLIENCLFGVDLNPNSVKICQLRLWIELLKHTYYIQGTNELETLPNIDINIKVGNSLISRFSLDEDIRPSLKSLKINISDYQHAVDTYRNAHDKHEKHELEQYIKQLKMDLKTEISQSDKAYRRYAKANNELRTLKESALFEHTAQEKKKIKALTLIVDKYLLMKAEVEHNIIYQNAFEWRVEFPEVLDDEGNFVGFDVVIGNPPYIQLQKMGDYADIYKDMNFEVFERTGDIYCLFYELGRSIVKPNYHLSFITSNKWMRAGYGKSMREFIVNKTNPIELIDFSGYKVFDEATVDVNILSFQVSDNKEDTVACKVAKPFNNRLEKLSDYISLNKVHTSFGQDAVSSFVILSEIERSIKAKIEAVGTPLKDWDINIYRGILTGYNEAFIIDGPTKDRLIAEEPQNINIIHPLLRGRDIKRYGYEFADKWLIYLPWHFPLHKDPTITGASKKAEKAFQENYPVLYDYMLQHKEKLSARNQAETGIRYEWYALQRWGAEYMDDFFKQKIVWKAVGRNLTFSLLEEGRFLTAPASFITSEHNKYILAFLSSSYGRYYIYQNSDTTGAGDIMLNIQSLKSIPIPLPSETHYSQIIVQVNRILENQHNIHELNRLLSEIDNLIYSVFKFNDSEIEFIENQ